MVKGSARPRPTGPHPGLGTGGDVWLFRHGEVHEDWQGKAYGGLDVPLSARGERDTRAVAELFGAVPFRAVVSSSLERARLLGELLSSASGAPLEVSDGLVEIARGRWQGRTVRDLFESSSEEVAAFYDDPWTFDAHGGETDADVLERGWPVLETALLAGGGPLALTAHYNVVRVLVSHAIGIDPRDSFRLRVDLGAVNVLRDGPGGWQLVRANVRGPGWPLS